MKHFTIVFQVIELMGVNLKMEIVSSEYLFEKSTLDMSNKFNFYSLEL